MLNRELEVTLNLAFKEARTKRHEFMTVEHLLLALLDNEAAAGVLRACGANLEKLRADLLEFIKPREPKPEWLKVRAPGMAFFLVALPVAAFAAFGADRILRREVASRTVLYLFGGFAAFADNEFRKLGSKAAIDAPARALGGLAGPNRFDPGAHVLVRGGTVDRSARWQSIGAPLVIGGVVHIDGKEAERVAVELAPGLELRFAEAGALDVGYYGPGALLAKGTAEAPIVFTTHEKRQPGGWGSVGVHAHGEATIAGAVFEFGGKGEDSGVLRVVGGTLALTGTTFRSNRMGVSADEAARLPTFADNKFAATPVVALLPAGLVAALGEDNAYDRDSRIRTIGGPVKGEVVWHAQGVPIEYTGEINVDGGSLTLEAGVALLAAAQAKFTVGLHEPAKLLIKGTAAAPVTIGPAAPGKQRWPGLTLASHARGNVIENLLMTEVEAATAIDVAAEVDATLTGVTCSRCSGAVVGWACGAAVTSSQVLAADGTPSVDVRPQGC